MRAKKIVYFCIICTLTGTLSMYPYTDFDHLEPSESVKETAALLHQYVCAQKNYVNILQQCFDNQADCENLIELIQDAVEAHNLKNSNQFLSRCLSTFLFEGKVSLKDGLNINYVQKGDGDRTVLFMPGALGTAKSDFMPQLIGTH